MFLVPSYCFTFGYTLHEGDKISKAWLGLEMLELSHAASSRVESSAYTPQCSLQFCPLGLPLASPILFSLLGFNLFTFFLPSLVPSVFLVASALFP